MAAMPFDRPGRTEHLFIVRLWSESADRNLDEWRGCVEHVASKRRLFFTNIADLPTFVVSCLYHHHPAVTPGKEQ